MNHFISVEGDGQYNYLLIHTGSRNLGLQVAKYHQDKASLNTMGNGIQDLIKELKESGQSSRIEEAIAAYKKEHADEISLNKELAFLQGEAMADYLHDVKREHIEELDGLLENVILKWAEEHSYLPNYFRVNSIEEVEGNGGISYGS